MRRLTRVFVRRQANWFKLTDPGIHWFDAGAPELDEIVRLVVEFNASS
jgi:tRNA dimethylallyltransferase